MAGQLFELEGKRWKRSGRKAQRTGEEKGEDEDSWQRRCTSIQRAGRWSRHANFLPPPEQFVVFLQYILIKVELLQAPSLLCPWVMWCGMSVSHYFHPLHPQPSTSEEGSIQLQIYTLNPCDPGQSGNTIHNLSWIYSFRTPRFIFVMKKWSKIWNKKVQETSK